MTARGRRMPISVPHDEAGVAVELQLAQLSQKLHSPSRNDKRNRRSLNFNTNSSVFSDVARA
jgi:hypothetical protein